MYFEHELEAYEHKGKEFFAYLPVKTKTGWTIWRDVVEIWSWTRANGWHKHHEKLYAF